MPGRYAVVGSSGMPSAGPTYTGYVGRTQAAGTADSNFDPATTRRIIIRPSANPNVNQFDIQSNSASQLDLNTVQPVVGIAINNPRSLSLTEPLDGYESKPTPGANWTATGVQDEPDAGSYSPPYGTPLDQGREGDWGDLLLSDRTYANKRTLCLQRLANPRLPWHAQANPYVTLDTASVDVTAFNGLDANTDPLNQGGLANISFSSFERGGSRYFAPPAPAPATRLFWRIEQSHNQADVMASPNETGAPHVFTKELFSTLGYLNQGYGQPYTFAAMPATAYVGSPVLSAPNQSAFPWLVFNNRPFMSPAELLHVPVTSQYQLLAQFNIVNGSLPANVYDNTQETDQVFGHLPNFLRTNATAGTISTSGTDGPLLARLLDYVEIPSRFVGTERYYNPSQFSTAGAPGNNPATGYRPPFNRMSRFRDPGRINLNTFADERIWAALTGEYMPGNSPPAAYPGWSTVQEISFARQGYRAQPSDQPGLINNAYPSIFSNPFRATEAADLMPVNLAQKEAYASLLRPRVQAGGTPGNYEPLLATSMANVQPHVDPSRSPFFRYLPLQKLMNNTTTNSNCFAVWITVGYFEVEDVTNPPNGSDPRRYPDGYMLGQELGLDSGSTERHRGFYLIDRSIPVGFIPGVKLNSENVVLLRRQID
jgi:hypothetical protein